METLKEVTEMSDRELLEECVLRMRATAVAVDTLVNNPMVKALSSGQNPMMAFLGR